MLESNSDQSKSVLNFEAELGRVKECAPVEHSEVARMFEGRSILITGASGFIGRVLLEKLLRCYTGIVKIYILLRTKKNESPAERLHKRVLNAPIFDQVKAIRTSEGKSLTDKIVVVPGDISEPKLGIAAKDIKMLLSDPTLSIVYHSAATIKFDEQLKVSVQLNLIATKTLIEFCRCLKNLISFCHVSTAYVNSHLKAEKIIEEQVYPMDETPNQIINLTENMTQNLMQVLKSNLVAERPNTYTYTKALTEHLIVSEATDLPVTIVRPSIVGASWREPVPGWVDNLNGPTGLFLALGKGLLRIMHLKRECIADVIPVDIVVNTLIAASYHMAVTSDRICGPSPDSSNRFTKLKLYDEFVTKTNATKEVTDQSIHHQVPIIHCTSGDLNKLTWGQLEDEVVPTIKTYPSRNIIRYPTSKSVRNKYAALLAYFFLHYLPALIIDTICLFSGKKARLVPIYRKLDSAISVIEHFTTHSYRFQSKNMPLLRECLNRVDREELYMDVDKIDWKSYWVSYILGIR